MFSDLLLAIRWSAAAFACSFVVLLAVDVMLLLLFGAGLDRHRFSEIAAHRVQTSLIPSAGIFVSMVLCFVVARIYKAK